MATILIACGGTGGHLFPGLAVADALRGRGHDVVLLVSSKAIDQTALGENPDYDVRVTPAVGWPGLSPRLGTFAVKLWRSVRECRQLFASARPDAVLGMGGFTSAVPLLMGKCRGLPTFVHESNAIPGRVTRMAARMRSTALVSLTECEIHLPRAKCVRTGTPVRADRVRVPRAQAAQVLGVSPEKKTVLIMGGSQGARGLNELVLRALPFLEPHREQWQFLHLTGGADVEIARTNYRRLHLQARVEAFAHDMQDWYSLADLAISRAGAASLAELAHYGLPSLLIPFPQAADRHQHYNAQAFAQAGAALELTQGKVAPEQLAAHVAELLQNDTRRLAMGEAARQLAVPSAAERIAEEIEACLKN